MTGKQQMTAFSDELDKLIERFRAEFDLPYAAAIGILQIKMHALSQEANEAIDDDED
jgi:hypothetical protein